MIHALTHAAFALPLSWSMLHFADLSRPGSAALIAAIWQGALLAAIAGLALRFAPRIPAAARFAIWFAVFTLIAALPMLQFDSHGSSQAATATGSHAFLNLDPRWTLAIASIWAAASLLRAATLIAAALRVRTLSRHATPIQLSPAPAAPSRRAQLCSSTDVDRPTVIGFFSPKILIPAWLLEKLTPAELDHVILHESIHLNRADDWLNLLQKFALVLFPLNPALAWVERRLCFERELACDERVLALLATRDDNHATSYASSLTTLAEYRLQHRSLVQNLALALGALGSSARESELGRRVASILRPAARMKPLHVRLATAAAIAGLLFTTTELEHTPQLISFASPAPTAQLAAVAPSPNTLLPGYRAVTARLTLPAPPQSGSIGDAAPRLAAAHQTGAPSYAAGVPGERSLVARVEQRTVGSLNAGYHAVSVRATQPAATPHLVLARQPETPQTQAPQSGLVITRYTVTAWQSADGYRIVRTSALISSTPSSAPQAAAPQQDDQTLDLGGSSNGAVRPSTSPRPHQISQPYAAVPVPGGWLIFKL